MKRNYEGNARKKSAGDKAEKENVHARNSGVEPELPMFDYSVDRVDRGKFNDSSRIYADRFTKVYGIGGASIIQKEKHPEFKAPVPPTAEKIAEIGQKFAELQIITVTENR